VIVLASACGGGGGGDDTPGDDTPGDDTSPDGDPGDPDSSTACGPTTCDGCCDGDTCRAGNAPEACGGGGAACAACEADFSCQAAACAVDPASRWDVLAVDATVFPDNVGGTAWDSLGGLPDPFVEMSTQDGPDVFEGVTAAIGDTITPAWNAVALDAVPARALVTTGLLITVYDDDLDADDSMGSCTVTFADDDAIFDGDPVAYECPTSGGTRGWTLSLQLRRD
jgi:hypothetical protein